MEFTPKKSLESNLPVNNIPDIKLNNNDNTNYKEKNTSKKENTTTNLNQFLKTYNSTLWLTGC